MKNHTTPWLLVLVLLIPELAFGIDITDNLTLRGYVRETPLLWELPAYLSTSGNDEQQFTNLLHTRQNLRYYLGNATMGVELKTRLFNGDAVQAMRSQTDQLGGNRALFNWEHAFVDENRTLLVSTIDRTWIDLYAGDWQVTIGRQRIAWGSTQVWNPTDIFNPSSPIDFDNEEKPGSDGVRIQRYLGTNSKLEFAFATSSLENEREMTVAGRVVINAFDYDWSLLMGSHLDHSIVGGGFEGDLFGGGFRGEVLYTIQREAEVLQVMHSPSYYPLVMPSGYVRRFGNYVRFALDGDYTFPNSFYLHGGVRYNKNGATEDAGALLNQYYSFEQQWQSPARWSLFGQIGGNPTALMRTDLMAILNPLDSSWYAGPTITYSVITNLDLTLTGLIFEGDTNTEFGGQGAIYMGRLKYSF